MQQSLEHINKLFIIGLPRTGTTSLCLALLELGISTAHVAYTQATITQAKAIADAPVFADYQALDKQYPNSRFIYLNRPMALWLPSIKQLLQRLHKNLDCESGGYPPLLKESYKRIFSPYTEKAIRSDGFLIECYLRHQGEIDTYFNNRTNDYLSIDIACTDSKARLLDFLAIQGDDAPFPHCNRGKKITYWNQIKHPSKIDSWLR